VNDPTVFGRDCFKPKCATTLFNQRDSADLTLPQALDSAGSVNVTRTRRAVRGGWETSTPKSAKSRRVVPIDAWLADDLRAFLANDHPHGRPANADYDPAAPLFPSRYGMTEPLPQGVFA
jgi:integrase